MSAHLVRRIVSAAMLMDDDLIVLGVRHYSPDMRAVLHRLYGDGYQRHVILQGFVDQRGEFLNRLTAWKVAQTAGQIIRDCGKKGMLYSEDLY